MNLYSEKGTGGPNMKILSLCSLIFFFTACTNQTVHPALEGPVGEWRQVNNSTWYVILEISTQNRELIEVKHYEGQSNASFTVFSACADPGRLLKQTIRLREFSGTRTECDPEERQGPFSRETMALILVRAPPAPDRIKPIIEEMIGDIPYEPTEFNEASTKE